MGIQLDSTIINWVFIKIVALITLTNQNWELTRLIADALKLEGCQWLDPVLHGTELTALPQIDESLQERNATAEHGDRTKRKRRHVFIEMYINQYHMYNNQH